MFIAKRKRKENIAEYILYLWQLEDLLRALEFDPDRIWREIVEPQRDLDDEQKQMLFFWYIDMVNLLKSEGKTEHGHLEHSMHLIDDLYDLHLRLHKLPVGKEYARCFARLAPELPRLKAMLGKGEMNDMEICFRALYSVVLLRLKNNGGEDTAYIHDVIELISPVVALLARIYRQVETGEIDLYKGTDGTMA